jgi:hypothetical protein
MPEKGIHVRISPIKFILLTQQLFSTTNAFVSVSTVIRSFRARDPEASICMNRNGLGDYDPEAEGFFDVETARSRLEGLLSSGGGDSTDFSDESMGRHFQQGKPSLQNVRSFKDQVSDDDDGLSKTTISGGASIASSPAMSDVLEPPPLTIELPTRPPLTSIERERRIAEIELLKHLREGDISAIADLSSLWFSERGPEAESILKETDDLMVGGDVVDMIRAERILLSLIEEYGVYFAEPSNRLATIYLSQGRLEEALFLNKIVLAVKPWHFGALSHIVMVYESLGDSRSARAWARFRLPALTSISNNKRQAHWAERAVMDAIYLYEQGEIANAISFGESDRMWLKRQAENWQNNDDNAWQ